MNGTTGPMGTQLRLATFNLESLGIWEKEDGPAARQRLPQHIAALRSVIRELQADAVAFQEVLDPELLTPLLDGLGYPHVVLGGLGSSPLRTGVFSRYPLRDPRDVAGRTSVQAVDPKTGLDLRLAGRFSRSVFQVTWETPGAETTLFVVHNKSKIPSFTRDHPGREAGPWPSLGAVAEGRLITEVKRIAQAMELRREIDGLLVENRDARIAVLGDFNDVLESEAVRCLLGDAQSSDSPHLACYELYPCAVRVPVERRYTQLYRGTPELIDHILVSQALRRDLYEVRILNEGLRETGYVPVGGEYAVGSDHAPVLAVFRAGG